MLSAPFVQGSELKGIHIIWLTIIYETLKKFKLHILDNLAQKQQAFSLIMILYTKKNQ